MSLELRHIHCFDYRTHKPYQWQLFICICLFLELKMCLCMIWSLLPILGLEGSPFFPRFHSNSSSSGGVQQPPQQSPSNIFPQHSSNGGHQQLPHGFLPRMNFPPIPPLQSPSSQSGGVQQSPQSLSLSKVPSLKTASEARSRQGDESSSSGGANPSGGPPGIVHNTLRKTKSDMKVIHRYLVQVKNDTREIHEIPPQDLCNYIQVSV